MEVFLLLTGFGLYRSLQRDPRIGAFYSRQFERVFLPAFVVVAVYYGLKDTGVLRYLSQLTLFGYWIGKPYWGRGLIPEAVRALQRVCFEELGCSGVWCGYYAGNTKSRRVQEKCGFVPHHDEENKACAKLGEIRTEYVTYLSRERWQARTATP